MRDGIAQHRASARTLYRFEGVAPRAVACDNEVRRRREAPRLLRHLPFGGLDEAVRRTTAPPARGEGQAADRGRREIFRDARFDHTLQRQARRRGAPAQRALVERADPGRALEQPFPPSVPVHVRPHVRVQYAPARKLDAEAVDLGRAEICDEHRRRARAARGRDRLEIVSARVQAGSPGLGSGRAGDHLRVGVRARASHSLAVRRDRSETRNQDA